MTRTGELVGTVAVRHLRPDIAEIKRLNVARQLRGRGLGDQLLRHAVLHAREKGFRLVRLDTFREEGPAVRLFRRHGFTEIPRYNDNPMAGFFMELSLTT